MSSINEKPEISPEPIDAMIQGYRISHILLMAIEKRVFTRLSESKSAKELAEEMETDPRTTEKFLNVLVTLGLLAKSDKEYTNTVDAETFLVEGKSHYIGNLVRITVGSNLLFSHLDEVLKNGGSLQEKEGSQEYAFDEVQILGHAEGALCYELPIIFDTLKDVQEFVNAKRILDLGGAHGVYSMAFAQKNPMAEVTLFDLPHVIEIAKKFIDRYGMNNQIELVAGDFNNDDIGNGYDLVFVSHVFYQKKGIESVLDKIYGSLNENGAVVLNHWVVNETRTSPRVSVLFDLYISIMNRDHHCYTVNEYTNLLEEAGFSKLRIFDIQTPPSPSMFIVGKKEAKK
ncbi:tRNA (mo5U34)-methyltransferase [ANME-1 cluster archaeon GoMg1]|nr:tRNA (mo5U34)-methyltransferase [ANME-1 cluster archaeon GoMg1]